MILYLLRHAKAEEKGKKPDKDRVLTAKGKIDALKKAQKFKNKLTDVSLILTSPYPRAKETAEIFANVLKKKQLLKNDEALIAGNSGLEILNHLREIKLTEHFMLAGHETWLSELTSLLIAGNDSCQIKIKKPGLVILKVEQLGPRGGMLIELR